jgi:hypothetical protein
MLHLVRLKIAQQPTHARRIKHARSINALQTKIVLQVLRYIAIVIINAKPNYVPNTMTAPELTFVISANVDCVLSLPMIVTSGSLANLTTTSV